ncbi:hypothetical protein ATL41_2382 [Flavimobilis soli]|uniref:CDP-glycerol:poly(Glycerophosphate) glycerophosphotransferase n=1 Tax=Flavimobilis soli TaxID=442709 RepID=A0A2A9EH76_9MICO|nr:hypothetical protein [Flavimobilis soli]PFG37615.1 hypothetical protein ATL41_2382 [Flavimobilis soli]
MLSRIAALRSAAPESLVALGLMIASLLAAAVAALLGTSLAPWLLLVSLLAEVTMRATRSGKLVSASLARAALGATTLYTLRTALLLVWCAVSDHDVLVPAALIAVAVLVLRLAGTRLARVVRRRNTPAIAVRNLDVPAAAPAPVRWPSAGRWKVLCEALVIIAVVLLPAQPWWAALVAVGAAAFATLRSVLAVLDLRAIGGSRTSQSLLPQVRAAIDARAPRTALYFSGDVASVYQANMWLETLERTAPDAVVIMRERNVFAALGPTSLPVVCVPDATTLMNLGLPTLRVALYPTNVGKNIHLLREPHIKSVFIGHGDSDKSASFNPYSRVYDEIWVAGPAGRERYRRAMIGIDDARVREVGRPQVADLAAAPPREAAVPTLLYAPTWEGWNEDQNYCSLETVGLPLVRRVVESGLPVRVIYRPHPFTGRRLASVAAANREIVRLLGDAVPAPPALDTTPGLSAVAVADALRARDEAWFAGLDARTHVALQRSWGVSMSACMAEATMLLTDVSSVLSDFLATDRPYAVADPRGVGRERFVEEFPSAAGGAVVTTAADVEALLDALARGVDELAGVRAALRGQLLGDHPEDAHATFRQAIADLAARADDRARAVARAAGTL